MLHGPEGVDRGRGHVGFSHHNNEAEYEALTIGLKMALVAWVKQLDVYTNSQLVAMQIEGSYETRELPMMRYMRKVKGLISRFDKCVIQQVPRGENTRADASSKFGTMIIGVKEKKLRFRIPRVLISDNVTQFEGKKIVEWCKELKSNRTIAVENPQANGQIKVSNRVLLQHLKTKLNGAKGSWVEELPKVLWAYKRDTVLLGLRVGSSNTYGDR
ncbi:UNVERIFIED_CONTAM: hypothetical protein Sangu_3006600 [Sesamum angustifolium]|uniref:RNase H type-1 domain-containing protein n=1 Tax=Sesamum angustifolium TaxID=2727405 RepID=A0AAW2KMW4_9LAMI